MRKIFKTVGVVIAVIFVLGVIYNRHTLLSLIPTNFSDVEMVYDGQSDTETNVRYYYNRLSDNAKIAYTLIVPEMYKHAQSIEIPMITEAELTALNYAVSYDNPDLICYSAECNVRTEGNKYYFEPEYSHTQEECDRLTSELKTEVDKVVKQAQSLSSDYEKEKYVHDYICEKCEYVLTDKLKTTSYDALIGGEAVCEGYARAAQLLLNRLGIENYLIIGDARDDDGNIEGHMWNIVKINGNNYHLDVTWDDTDQSDSPDIKTHIYFNLTTKQISQNHFNMNPAENNCTADEFNYAKAEGLLFGNNTSTLKTNLEAEVVRNYSNGTSYVEVFAVSPEAYAAIYKSLVDSDGISEIAVNVRNKNKNIKFTQYQTFEDSEMCYMQFVLS